jgi:phosphoglycolate phosphatase
MNRLVIYDLDGTLLDTVGEISAALNLALADFGSAPVDEDQVRAWVGYGTARLIEQACEASAILVTQEQLLNRFTLHYQNTVATDSKLFPYVLETLQRVRALGVKQAVVTNKDAQFTSRLLRQYAMEELFDLVISGDSLPIRKPDPGVVRYCLESLQETPENSLYVGDSVVDVAAAHGAGVSCWLVPYGYNGGRDIADSCADRVIDDLRDVYTYLQVEIECED